MYISAIAKKPLLIKKTVRFLKTVLTKTVLTKTVLSKSTFLSYFSLKENHKIAGITNCEITKCGDPLYTFVTKLLPVVFESTLYIQQCVSRKAI